MSEKNWWVVQGVDNVAIDYLYRGERPVIKGSTVSIVLTPEAALLMAAQLLQAVMGMKL